MCENRLSNPVTGFDSIDDRMTRVPNDLNDPKLRAEYIRNHVKWFLSNHEDAIPEFIKEVKAKYGEKLKKDGQMDLLDELIKGVKKPR